MLVDPGNEPKAIFGQSEFIAFVFLLWNRGANEHMGHLMVGDQRRPWTPATPKESQVHFF